ncbi:ATP-grasp domain-containing protein [Variovorax sp. J22R133]|uniref:ATP-grasp domain-containing protein n=1 Tax=Variovorax brevis TaxID=3053503 RepID=UPI002577F88D|nr:ATP-grasp domain-containing protein [Variovorax sp. J22R133]MDM0115953.1 ATP-grasp domain-containing protein [Variovorax sp. J22R133]
MSEALPMPVLAVAAISARMLAESAVRDGFEVVALDLFGDTDTRRACTQWHSIGDATTLHIDGERLLSALEDIAKQGRVSGWIAGSGFEGQPDLVAHGAALLPLMGTPAEALRRVRDPLEFFGFLDAHGIAHPEVSMSAPEDGGDWLVKDANGCGGWHIHRAETGALAPTAHHYFQREVPGVPMSATFVANGQDAVVLGFNELIVRPVAGRPFVYCGVVGPVALPSDMAARITEAVRTVAKGFALRGLGSIDFMRNDSAFRLLEVNPRPPASMALYPHGTFAAHVRACTGHELPPSPVQAANDHVRGTEFVYARHAMRLDDDATMRLANRPDCHDLPNAATRFEAGDPVCSVSAGGNSAQDVHARLARRREAVHQFLETCE